MIREQRYRTLLDSPTALSARQRLIAAADAYASGWLAATPPASPIIAAVDGATQPVARARGA